MKLTFSPSSPFARKERISAIELALIDRIELVPTTVAPTTPNEKYADHVNPLRKLPALILDNGQVLFDSTVIIEYLDDLAGGGKLFPAKGPERWQVKTENALIQGTAGSAALAEMDRRSVGSRLAWPQIFRGPPRDPVASVRHHPDRPGLPARLCRPALSGLPVARGLSQAQRLQ